MYSTLFTTTLVFALAALGVRADFTVYTPQLTQCQPATLTWDPASGPYDVIIVPASDPCGDAVVDFGDAINGTSYQWPKVTLAAGAQVVVSVMDSTNQEGWSGTVTVQPSDDSSCLNSQGNSPGQNPPAPSPTPQDPTHPSPTPSPSPTPTVVGAANNGLMNGGSMLQFSGVGVVVTALGALAALL